MRDRSGKGKTASGKDAQPDASSTALEVSCGKKFSLRKALQMKVGAEASVIHTDCVVTCKARHLHSQSEVGEILLTLVFTFRVEKFRVIKKVSLTDISPRPAGDLYLRSAKGGRSGCCSVCVTTFGKAKTASGRKVLRKSGAHQQLGSQQG